MKTHNRIWAERAPWKDKDSIGIHLFQYQIEGLGGSNTAAFATNIEFQRYEEGSCAQQREPLFYMRDREAQELIDCLYECGFRPSRERGDRELITAKDSHIADFRKILFKTLGVE